VRKVMKAASCLCIRPLALFTLRKHTPISKSDRRTSASGCKKGRDIMTPWSNWNVQDVLTNAAVQGAFYLEAVHGWADSQQMQSCHKFLS